MRKRRQSILTPVRIDNRINGEWHKERAIWRFESDIPVHYEFSKNKRWT